VSHTIKLTDDEADALKVAIAARTAVSPRVSAHLIDPTGYEERTRLLEGVVEKISESEWSPE
jgi:hypothetical protein